MMGLLLLFSLLFISCIVLATNGQYNDEHMSSGVSHQHALGDKQAAGKAMLPAPYSIGESNVRKKSETESKEVGLKARHASKKSHRPAGGGSTIHVLQGPHHVNNRNYGLRRTNGKRVESRIRSISRDSHRQDNRKAGSALHEDRGSNRDVFSGTRRRSRNGPTESIRNK
ncbi:uncharacterized protein Dvir_GJ25872 [Drosophila virilis]|uniref:Uncharacterized protein n=1 Tax=Drosophila virilis TaxID=7244 RepID=A0A0Q9WV04_DROVI|nr:uncharacterized protein LOC26530642 [Drosophila virilis]KRF84772.1 uncharacterized protein Dvir_GJ25872 [Drosophila virilis]